MKHKLFKTLSVSASSAILLLMLTGNAQAYSCKAIFKEADGLISKAEAMVTVKTDSRIKAMLAEAKGLAKAGLVSHTAANESHHGNTGKYAHGDSVRKGHWAVSLAKEALFLLSGKPQ